ncbi:hypothetical protein BX661DRAFT_222607 [Kickxella alabastrina]|uniref:uncharacterized protein n=1 Tax=Kickxella alabastrina TaxID=61397 RepID=UPI00221FFBC4|nr:uncharacterized protein BX661DRAFT_222607 [Kickxella alabastrina]KAI7833795.1 hypothetical protein BX661DRAFT_222607 [Kickxella alabastrina]
MTAANLLGFVFTAVKALLEVFLIGFSGYIFARNGTLNKPTLKLWNEPIFYFIYGGFSLLWSRTGSQFLGLNPEYARLCDVATFFSNTNTLPVSLIKSIALSSGSQFLLKDQNDTPLKSAFNSNYASPRTPAGAGIRLPESPALVASGSNGARILGDNELADDELAPLYLGAPAQAMRRPSAVSRAVALAGITPPVYAIVAAFLVITIEPLHRAFMEPNNVLYTLWSAIDMCGDACVPLILISLGGQLGMMARNAAAAAAQQAVKTPDIERHAAGSPGSTRTPSVAQLAGNYAGSVPSIVVRSATGSGNRNTLGTPGFSEPEEDDNAETAISAAEQRKGVILVLAVYILTLLILSGTPPAINLITVSQATGKFETEAAEILFYGYILGIFVLAIEVSGFLWLTSVLGQM